MGSRDARVDRAEQLLLFKPHPGMYVNPKRCPVCGGTLIPDPRGQTYVMRRQRWVKIGKSHRPETRLRELRPVSKQRYIITPRGMDAREPITIVALVATDQEHALHVRWHHLHERGEWFAPDAEMERWLRDLDGSLW